MQDKPLPSMIGNVSNALVLELMKFKADHHAHQDHNLLVELFLSRRMAKSQLILRLLFNSLLEFLKQFAATTKKKQYSYGMYILYSAQDYSRAAIPVVKTDFVPW